MRPSPRRAPDESGDAGPQRACARRARRLDRRTVAAGRSGPAGVWSSSGWKVGDQRRVEPTPRPPVRSPSVVWRLAIKGGGVQAKSPVAGFRMARQPAPAWRASTRPGRTQGPLRRSQWPSRRNCRPLPARRSPNREGRSRGDQQQVAERPRPARRSWACARCRRTTHSASVHARRLRNRLGALLPPRGVGRCADRPIDLPAESARNVRIGHRVSRMIAQPPIRQQPVVHRRGGLVDRAAVRRQAGTQRNRRSTPQQAA